MAGALQETPGGERVHIGFYGRRNSGKSSLMNAFAGQDISVVSDVAGTTTDPVRKAMELHGLGACVLIDTAGYDDEGKLGRIRVERTRRETEKTDIAVILFSEEDIEPEVNWYYYLKKERNIPVVAVVSKSDIQPDTDGLRRRVEKALGQTVIAVSAKDGTGMVQLREGLVRALPEDMGMSGITGHLAAEGDVVLLVMPQDIQAPKGRLILPQVQTIRELLDKKALVISVTADKMTEALAAMKEPPRLIITDSQVFRAVYEKKPADSLLTSFSVLFAAYKGDLDYYIQGAEKIGELAEQDRVLIAECCTHAPLTEDIGREKLPRMLRQKAGQGLSVEIVSGMDFPEDLTSYDLVIQCGACMFNRKYVMSRIDRAKRQRVPMTNYGVAAAYLSGILDKIAR